MIEALAWLSTFALGLLAGSLCTEAMILVPYWRKMEPAEFFRLHPTMGPSLFRYFAPLTSLTVGLALSLVVADRGQAVVWVVAAGLCLAALAIFFLYFRAANNRFATHAIANEDLRAELNLWSNWHWLRTAFVVVAFGSSILGHMGIGR